MNISILFLPGVLFLLVILFRVIVPLLKTPGWQRLLQQARYLRHKGEAERGDQLLQNAVEKYPQQPEVYLEYFLNHSNSKDLKGRFAILQKGFEQTKNRAIAFFIGSGYLEEGMFSEAAEYLEAPGCREYLLEKRIPLLPQFYYEQGDYKRARKEYLAFYRKVFTDVRDEEELLKLQSPQELILFALIQKSLDLSWGRTMALIPKKGVHADMSWKDYLALIKEQFEELKPAATGIRGDAGEFNRRRREYFEERISLVESYL